MKNLISFITLLFFLHTITNHLATTEAKTSATPDPVVDIDGDELLIGNPYDIAPVFRPGGGIDLEQLGGCRFSVFQHVIGEGVPVYFDFESSAKGDVVLESTDLTIYSAPKILIGCNFFWKVAEKDEHFIFTDGYIGSPAAPRSRYFRIKKNESSGDYRFVFCPEVSRESSGVESCKDVGIVFHDGRRRLALGGESGFTFRFRKVKISLKQVVV